MLQNYATTITQPKPTTKPIQQALVPKVEKPFTFSTKDKDFLKFILEMKFMSMDQAQRKFLVAGDIHLKEMLDEKLIYFHGTPVTKDSLICPTLKLHELLKKDSQGKEVPVPLKRIFQPAVNHDLKLVELRMRFEHLHFIERWFSEKSLETLPLLQRTFKDLPDAVCKKKNGKSYFLELEISKKSPKVYSERIKEYEQALLIPEIKETGIEGVIFFCVHKEVQDCIKGLIPKSSKFSVLSFDRYFEEATK